MKEKRFSFMCVQRKNKSYRICQLNFPRKYLKTLRTGQFFIVFPQYMMAQIRKKQFFVILSGTHSPLYAQSVFA